MGSPDDRLRASLKEAEALSVQPVDAASADEWEKWMEFQVAAGAVAGWVHSLLTEGVVDRREVAEAGLLFDGLQRMGWRQEEMSAWQRVRDLLLAR